MIRCKGAENLPTDVAALLRDAGHDALTVHDERLHGESDHLIASVCQQERLDLVTLDTDFAEYARIPPQSTVD